MRRQSYLVWVALIAVLASGCWDTIEIDNRAIVLGLGVDLADDEGLLLVSVALPNPHAQVPGQGGGAEAQFITLSATGRTVREAGLNLESRISRQLFLGQLQVLIFSEEVVRTWDARDLFDVFRRSTRLPVNTYVLISRGNARDALVIETRQERLPTSHVRTFFETPGKPVARNLLWRLDKLFMSPSLNAFVPGIQVGEDPPQIIIQDTAVFRGERMVGWLDARETLALLMVLGEAEGLEIGFRGEDDDDLIYVTDLAANSRIRPQVDGDQISFSIDISARATAIEVEGRGIVRRQDVRDAEQRLAARIRAEVLRLMERLQKDLRTDVVGFAEELRAREPRTWDEVIDQWAEIFPDIPFMVNVKATLTGVGAVGAY